VPARRLLLCGRPSAEVREECGKGLRLEAFRQQKARFLSLAQTPAIPPPDRRSTLEGYRPTPPLNDVISPVFCSVRKSGQPRGGVLYYGGHLFSSLIVILFSHIGVGFKFPENRNPPEQGGHYLGMGMLFEEGASFRSGGYSVMAPRQR